MATDREKIVARMSQFQKLGDTIEKTQDPVSGLENKVDKVTGKGLSTNDYTTAEKNKLSGIEAGADATTADKVRTILYAVSTAEISNSAYMVYLASDGITWGKSSWSNLKATITKSDIGLGNVDNTSDTNKPISTAVQNALNLKENTISAGLLTQYYRGDKSWQTLDKSTVGLGNVTNDAQVKRTEIGAASGVAPLGTDSKVPAAYLTQIATSSVTDANSAIESGSYFFTGATNSPTGNSGDLLVIKYSGTGTITQMFIEHDSMSQGRVFCRHYIGFWYTWYQLWDSRNVDTTPTWNKGTLADNDLIGIMDSADSNYMKKIFWSNVKTAIKNYAGQSGFWSYGAKWLTTSDGTQSFNSSAFPRVYSAWTIFDTTYSQKAFTTAEFITLIQDTSTFQALKTQSMWISRGDWYYAGTGYISDSGFGNIQLAGATVELIGTFGASTDTHYHMYTLRIHCAHDGHTYIYTRNQNDQSYWRRIIGYSSSTTPITSDSIASQSVLRSDYLKSHDIGSGWDDFVPSSVSRNIRFEFKDTTGAAPPNMGMYYGGCLHISPYMGTTGSTGDSSYQLAIYKSGGHNDIQTPRLAIRAGIDSSWGAWKEIITSLNIKDYVGYQSLRDFGNGTLIKTSIDYSVTEGNPFFLEIKGNSYGSFIPFDIKIQGYIYADTIICYGGISNGTNIVGLVAICYNGQLCFWFPRQEYWQGFTVRCVTSNAGNEGNLVWSITDEVQPTTYKQVSIGIDQSVTTRNMSSYVIGLKASGATLFWSQSHPSDYYLVNNWTGAHWQITSNHGHPVRVGYADSAESAIRARRFGVVPTNDRLHSADGNEYYADYCYGDKTPIDSFSYTHGTPWNGPFISTWGGLSSGNYCMQINAQYNGVGSGISFRTRNGDSGTWNPWYQFVHSGGGQTIAGTLGVSSISMTTTSANTGTAYTLSSSYDTFILTLTGNCTVTMPTGATGSSRMLTVMLINDSTAGRTVTFSSVKWNGGTAPSRDTTASAVNIYQFINNGTTWYGFLVGVKMS